MIHWRVVPVVALSTMLVLAGSISVSALGPAASPGPAATATPTTTSPSPDVPWHLVDGVLGNAIPMLHVDTMPPLAWAGRFWATETDVVAVPPGESPAVVAWHVPGMWHSSDGVRWQRRLLPAAMTGQLSLMPWREGLVMIDQRYDGHRGTAFAVWASPDGLHWRRHGGLDLRPAGDLRGCGLQNTFVATAGDRLVITASCAVPQGAGGDIAPGSATSALAAVSARRTIPTYTWTSTDGRRWARHTVLRATDYGAGLQVFSLFQSVGDGVGAIALGRQPRLMWSADGARFRTVARLPDVPFEWVADIDAVGDATGRPGTWLLLLAAPVLDATVAHPADPTGWTLWTMAGAGGWRLSRALGAVTDADIAVDGPRVGVVAGHPVVAVDDEPVDEAATMETLRSDDGAATWTSSVDPTVIIGCRPRLAMLRVTGVLGCDETDGAGLRYAVLWSAP